MVISEGIVVKYGYKKYYLPKDNEILFETIKKDEWILFHCNYLDSNPFRVMVDNINLPEHTDPRRTYNYEDIEYGKYYKYGYLNDGSYNRNLTEINNDITDYFAEHIIPKLASSKIAIQRYFARIDECIRIMLNMICIDENSTKEEYKKYHELCFELGNVLLDSRKGDMLLKSKKYIKCELQDDNYLEFVIKSYGYKYDECKKSQYEEYLRYCNIDVDKYITKYMTQQQKEIYKELFEEIKILSKSIYNNMTHYDFIIDCINDSIILNNRYIPFNLFQFTHANNCKGIMLFDNDNFDKLYEDGMELTYNFTCVDIENDDIIENKDEINDDEEVDNNTLHKSI